MSIYVYKNKPDSCAKETFQIDLGMDNKNSTFKDSELGIKQQIEKNVKKIPRSL